MLILARKQNETIVINDEITIEILQIKGSTIRLGIGAPNDVRIIRGELMPVDADGGPVDSNAEVEESLRRAAARKNDKRRGRKGKRANVEPKRSVGLGHFLSSESSDAADTRTPHEAPSTATATSEQQPTRVMYEGPLSRQSVNRLSIVSDRPKKKGLSDQVGEARTTYQATCEIELPIAQLRSNQN